MYVIYILFCSIEISFLILMQWCLNENMALKELRLLQLMAMGEPSTGVER